MTYRQEPVAIVGFACRLPGGNHTPRKLWEFLEKGGIAPNQVPESRFNINGHYDGSEKPGTMRPPGGMFLGDVDLTRFDPGFFEISGLEAIAMDPNQRQMLEVVVEGLENAGISLEQVNEAPIACFVGSYASDYSDMHSRDPEDRPANCPLGVGRAILANRISYCLNLKGPSITIDTACSGSLVGIDLACRVIQSGEVNAAIVATSNLYLNPEHVMDIRSVGQAHSPTALCHTFDAAADGYVKAEAVSCVIIKRLSDAIRDRDPIRAVIRGTASTSNGRTGGIASPNWEAQTAAIRTAYANAGISNLNDTAYLECHGTGTQAGDYAEVKGAGATFAPGRPEGKPLIIGSIKSNVGHSEPAAGMSGLIKTVLAMETGIIPGTPLFQVPNPSIDFAGNNVAASRSAQRWPETDLRRASINSFGFGGSNAHAIIEQAAPDVRRHYTSSFTSTADKPIWEDEEEDGSTARPQLLIVSGNDAVSLHANIAALCDHVVNPRVTASLLDLAYTLSERRSRLWHRAFVTTSDKGFSDNDFIASKRGSEEPRVGFIFTGQGAQWSQMGRLLLRDFPLVRPVLEELDQALQRTPDPPSWSLLRELTEPRPAEQLRRPEMSQPLTTAFQLCILAVLEAWGVKPCGVLGHSSGEIAAAYSAGLLSRQDAIIVAQYRGQAALNRKADTMEGLGMLAVGLSAKAVAPFLAKTHGRLHIACFNSPESLTISGPKEELEALRKEVTSSGSFARLLQVDMAYHSPYVSPIADEYLHLLNTHGEFSPLGDTQSGPQMISTVTGTELVTKADSNYWRSNMVSPVRFEEALQGMLSLPKPPDMLIEIGPSGALSGPVTQILKSVPQARNAQYNSSWARGEEASKSLFDLAGHLFNAGGTVNLSSVNEYDESVRTIVDLPNYRWNHSVRYWHENSASLNWRFKQFPTHDLTGSKTLSSSWKSPTWHKQLLLDDVPWLRDHMMGSDVLIPGAGLVTMALEAMYQKHSALHPGVVSSPNELCFRFKNVRFERALVVEEDKRVMIMLSLSPISGSRDWHEFRITTMNSEVEIQHCTGLVRVQSPLEGAPPGVDLEPLRLPTSAKAWYKAQNEIGMGFGPAFQKIQSVECTSGKRFCRTLVSLTPPQSKHTPQSYYPFHPAVLDSMLQTATPANASGDRSTIRDVMVPSIVDDMIINKVPYTMDEGLSIATSDYSGRGRRDVAKSWVANITIHDPATGATFLKVSGLRYTKLDVNTKPDPHTFSCISWKPDISLLDPEQLIHTQPRKDMPKLDFVLDLISHKKPVLNVLELSLDQSDDSCLWFQVSDFTARMAYSWYGFASTNAEHLVKIQEQNESRANATFYLANQAQEGLGLAETQSFDLVIIKIPSNAQSAIKSVLTNMRPLLQDDALILLVPSQGRSLAQVEAEPVLPNGDTDAELDDPQQLKYLLEEAETIGTIHEIETSTDHTPAYLCSPVGATNLSNGLSNEVWQINIIRLTDEVPGIDADISDVLMKGGWNVTQSSDISGCQEPRTIALVLDEISYPLLRYADDRQWEAVKRLLNSHTPVLWVTKGAQMSPTHPDHALVHGLFRVVRREELSANLTLLDISSDSSAIAGQMISQVADQMRYGKAEAEYVEHQGCLHVPRIMPDTAVNTLKRAEEEGVEPSMQGLFETQTRAQLLAERVGTLEMAWHETDEGQAPELEDGWIEVEVEAIGVNFKDVATTMGIVPENEHALGCECAGTVKKLGKGATKFRLGDRVVILRNATFANRCRAPETRAHAIPSWMSIEDAATIPVAYATAIYSMLSIGNLQEGQTVLIHSAAGGVGLAALQIALYKKAEVYATVGTDDKRKYLIDDLHIPPDRVFSSRSAEFADEILRATNGRGADLILNSLTGDLLDASWRLCADGGTMVEIGKKDIVDRNKLSMEPFDRACSFRAVDLSYVNVISDSLIEILLKQTFDLAEYGHVKVIRPVSYYAFDAIPNALVQLRSGKHIGKIVISKLGKPDIKVPIKLAIPSLQLRSEASYLIIGGLGGLCGSLAVHLARHGARHIIIFNRSGSKDAEAAKIIRDCDAYGCRLSGVQNDVRDLEAVRNVVNCAVPPIRGVIQGAMVLRDKPFETMTIDDYQVAIGAKVQGTWNIHQALQGSGNQELDFFTMLSSISGVVGNKGQANYAAANTFLDAFAGYRNRLGLPANTVDLGLVQDVGYVAEQGGYLEERFDKATWTPLNKKVLRKVLSYSIMQQKRDSPINAESKAQLITGIAYPLGGSDQGLATEPRFAYLTGGHDSSNSLVVVGEENESSRKLDQAVRAFRVLHASGQDLANLVTTCVGFLSIQVTKILRLETEVDPGKPLIAYGLDSLSAVELRSWVRMRLGAELSTLDIINASSLTSLSEKLISKIPLSAG
ncbi:hypothetical protein SUNI508_11641 [Seiridium unicorne]|uniref:Polyketide synthase n=1 Tax=Seiridium unicorne TaxID=138068 RepID=A0ABR2UGS4_9PEZI